MRRIYIVISVVLLLIVGLLWGTLYTPIGQDFVRKKIETLAESSSGYKVKVHSVRGIVPFILVLDGLEVFDKEKKIVEIDSMQLVPAWIDIFLGRIGILQLAVDGVRCLDVDKIEAFTTKNKNSTPAMQSALISYLPKKRISIHSFSLRNVLYKELYSAHGSFFWNHKKPSISASLEIENADKSSLAVDVKAKRKEIKATVKCSLVNFQKVTKSLESGFAKVEIVTSHPALILPIFGEIHAPSTTEQPLLQTRLFASLKPKDEIAFEITCEGSLSKDKIASFIISKVQGLGATSKGTLKGKCVKQSDTYTLDIASDLFSLNTLHFTDIHFRLLANKQNDLWQGSYLANSLLQNQPLHMDGKWATDAKTKISLINTHASLHTSTLDASIECLFDPCLLKGKIEGSSADISPFTRFFKKTIQGSGTIKAAFEPIVEEENGQPLVLQKIDLTASLDKLQATNFGFHKIIAEIHGKGPLLQPDLTIQLSSKKGEWKHLEFADTEVSARLDLAKELYLPLQVKTSGKIDKGVFSVACNITVMQNAVEMKAFSLAIDKTRADLQKPFSFSYTKEDLTLTPFTLLWNKGASLTFGAHINSSIMNGDMNAVNVPLDFIHFFFPTNLHSGTISGKATLLGSLEKPLLHIDLQSNDLAVGSADTELALPLTLTCKLDADEKQAICTGSVATKAYESEPLQWHFTLPIQIQKAPFFVTVLRNKKFEGKVTGTTDVAPFFTSILDEDQLVEGVVSLNTKITGTLDRPKFGGSLTWKDGKLDIIRTGCVFSGITMQSSFRDNILHIDSFQATDEKKGQVSAKGNLQLSFEKKFPFELDITSKELEIVSCDFATVSATGSTRFFGNLEAAKIEGALIADSAELNLTSDFSSDYPVLDFTFVKHEEAAIKPLVTLPFVLLFDLQVALPEKRCKIVGRGIDSVWTGDLKLTGSTDKPALYGEIASTKGSFQFANKKFELTQGSLTCAGDIFSESRINACASYDLGEIQAHLFLRGSLEKPRVSFESSPQLSEKEVLSWILFNKPLADISPVEGLQLASIALNMQGNKGTAMSVLEKVKQKLGIDQIDIKSTENKTPGDPNDALTVQLGKYVTKDVLMMLSKDVANAVNRVAIEAKLHKNVSVQAEVGDDREGQMSLMWKHDY